MLTKVLGNPEHRGRIRGMSSRKSWKEVDSWQTDAATYRSRQRYKEGLVQKGYDQAMEKMISQSIQDVFTSNDPKMVAMRSQMLR
jgi:hypothetical protein